MTQEVRVMALCSTRMGIGKKYVPKGSLGYGEKYTPDDGIERWNVKWDRHGIGSHRISDIAEAPQEAAKVRKERKPLLVEGGVAIDRRSKRGRELAERLNKETILEQMPRIYYVEDPYHGGYRIGRSDWAGDTFLIIAKDDFDTFYTIMKQLDYPVDDKTHDE